MLRILWPIVVGIYTFGGFVAGIIEIKPFGNQLSANAIWTKILAWPIFATRALYKGFKEAWEEHV